MCLSVFEAFFTAPKSSQYAEYQEILGNRNSFSKTDHDATFMRMKDDHMKNGQLKAGYNIQIGVDSEYIVSMDVYPESNRNLVKRCCDFKKLEGVLEKYIAKLN